jgi:hypothetical protein
MDMYSTEMVKIETSHFNMSKLYCWYTHALIILYLANSVQCGTEKISQSIVLATLPANNRCIMEMDVYTDSVQYLSKRQRADPITNACSIAFLFSGFFFTTLCRLWWIRYN